VTWQSAPQLIPLLLAALLTSALALYAWQRRHTLRGLRSFVLMLIAVTQWTLSNAMKLAAVDLTAKLFWANVQSVGIALVPTLWLFFCLEYTGESQRLKPRHFLLLSIEPMLYIITVWTNSLHHLFRVDSQLILQNGIVTLDQTHGPVLAIHAAYSYLLLLISAALLFRTTWRTTHLYRNQAIALMIAGLLPTMTSLLYVFDIQPLNITSLTPLTFTLSAITLAWALFRLRLLDIVPVARDTVIENLQDGIIVLDEAGRIADINPAGARILRKPVEQLLGSPASDAFASGPGVSENYALQTQLRSAIVSEMGDGTHYFEMRISNLHDQNGQPKGRLIVLHDITQRREAETALKEAKETAETASRTKSEFLATMSHELRMPLNSIIGYTDLTLMGTYGDLTDRQRDRLEKVSDNGKHLLQIITDIMDISRIEAKDLHLNLEQVDLNPLLEQCLTTATPIAEEKGLTLTHNVITDLPPITADPRRVRQIVLNLLGNAIKFTEDGMIVLHASVLDKATVANLPVQAAGQHEQWALIAVEDTGIGIARQDEAAAFEDFRQVDGSSTRQYQGVGLGLTIARRFTTLMNGHIWMESQPEQGTTFYVLLPAAPAIQHPTPAEATAN
jgi:PAS domain S-box-containing protein